MRKIIVFLLSFTLISTCLKAQDVGFSQFYANMLYLNPALAGTTKCPKISLSYRNHFPTLPNAYTTYSASYDQYFKGIRGGVGVLIMRDQQGEGMINTTSGALMYSFTFKATRNMYVKAGFQAGFLNRFINTKDMVFPDMINETTGTIQPGSETLSDKTSNHIDFAAGIAAYSRNFYFGVAAHHLNEWKDSENTEEYFVIARKYTAHAGVEIPIGGTEKEQNFSISPNVVAQMQDNFEQINYGFYAKWKSVVAGLWARQNLGIDVNTATILLGYYTQSFKIGYSFDFPISELKKDMFVAHEVSLSIFLPCGHKKKTWEAISCPKF